MVPTERRSYVRAAVEATVVEWATPSGDDWKLSIPRDRFGTITELSYGGARIRGRDDEALTPGARVRIRAGTGFAIIDIRHVQPDDDDPTWVTYGVEFASFDESFRELMYLILGAAEPMPAPRADAAPSDHRD